MLRTVEPVKVSIEDDLKLDENLTALLELVDGVTVEDEVEFSFTVHFLNICK